MQVTIVCDVLGAENNGTTIAAVNLMRSLKEKGHTVHILCPDADKKELEGYYIVPAFDLGPFNAYVKKNGVVIAKADNSIIARAISGSDIVHVMTPFSLCRRAAAMAREAGIPVSAGFHAMAENLTCHLFMKDMPLANRLTYAYYAGLFQHCDAIHYPTQFLRDLYESMYGETNGYVVSNGVNEAFVPREAQKPAAFRDRLVILFTGRFSKEKSHKVLIDAAACSKYRDRIQLVFAGNGPLREKLTAYAAKLPIAPVFDFFTREQMVELINCADLYVHPAEIEAEGISCLEAISCGLVPVISDSPRCATKVYAIDERNLFRYNSPASLAERIDWWLEHPAEKAARGREYAGFAKERLNQRACMDRMERMLLETVARKKAGA